MYILLNNYKFVNDETRRAVYVGMTRAKNELHIHYNNSEFDKFKNIVSEYLIDKNKYDEPKEIVVQLSHREVYLDYFKNKKHIIKNLVSGQKLEIYNEYLLIEIENQKHSVLKFSQSFINFIEQQKQKGYCPLNAQIRFIVAWKGESDNDDSMIILPDIKFVK